MIPSHPIEAVLFDLDGTLIDTAPDFVHVVNELRQQKSMEPLPFEAVRQQVSNGARALVALSFGSEETNSEFPQLLEALLNLYEQHLAVKSKLFEGLEQTLTLLEQRNIPWGIVTNKPSRFTNPLIAGLQLGDRCAVAVCPDQVTNRKPHPEPIFKACNMIGVKPEHTIYVGDHLRDIEAGNRANNTTVAVGWGYLNEGDKPEDWQADITVNTTEEFNDWLEKVLI